MSKHFHSESEQQRHETRAARLAAIEAAERGRLAREQAVQDALRRKTSRVELLQERLTRQNTDAAFAAFVKTVTRKAGKLADPACLDWLSNVYSLPAIRSLDSWKPDARGRERLLRSLTDHMLVKYRMPAFMYNVFKSIVQVRPSKSQQLFIKLATGASVSQCAKDGLLPVCLTKRMHHLFLQGVASDSVESAVRRAQVTAFGGSPQLADAINQSRIAGFYENTEPFWQGVIQWLCNTPMLDPNRVVPMIDYLFMRLGEDANFSMKGRTVGAVLRDTELWHATLANTRVLKNYAPFAPSGLQNGVWEEGQDDNYTLWSISELLTPAALAKEGRDMHHCVYSYENAIRNGSTSIWSLHMDSRAKGAWRVLTVEVRNISRTIVQARGLQNRSPTNRERHYLQLWAYENGLEVRC